VPFEVTGDGPTISLGEVIWRPPGDKPSSFEDGRSAEDSPELRVDLGWISMSTRLAFGMDEHCLEARGVGLGWRVWTQGEVGIWRKGGH
jgi:hypothetical protein